MKSLIASLLVLYVVAAIFAIAGYATGRIKHRFTAILCLVTIASVPFFVLLPFPMQKTADLPAIAMCVILFAILAIAGHMMGRQASSRSVFLARVTVCTSVLIMSAYLALKWGYSTNMVNAGFEHQDHARVGHWEFSLPSRWYPNRNASSVMHFWLQLGAKEALELHRASWSAVPDQSVVWIITPVSSTAHLHLEDRHMVQDQRFRIEGEYGRCSLTISDQKELRYEEWCLFPNADLAINIEARTEEDLLEAAHIVSGARFLKVSDPYSIRQPS
ncbi:MAG TPA: hypothetical protein VKV30_10180 [Candidatus Angelobacter sp.]|nr:hypothetical protein [Candidatus Angelobacter sp.]